MARDYSIDFLRFVGISLIIMAHVYPPDIIFQLRTFDVPLMVFISGLVYANRQINSYRLFLIHRIKRLCFPVWIFLTVYFLLIYGLKELLKVDWEITSRKVIESYLLMGGIGYVWIIRVFLLIAIVTPFLIRLNRWFNTKGVYLFCSFILIAILFQSILIHWGVGIKSIFIRNFIYYLFGYSILFLVGCSVKNCSIINQRKVTSFCGFLLIVFWCWYYYTTSSYIVPLNDYKYPPRLYFLIYGLFVSSFLWMLLRKRKISFLSRISNFVGSGTIWIYLLHIPFVHVVFYFDIEMWWIRYIIVYIGTVSLYIVQYKIVDILGQKHPQIRILKYLKG